MKYLVPSLAIFGLIVTSCATTKSFDNDDVYSVRTSELPIGESTADEFSYSSFKTRKEGKANDKLTYSDDMALQNRQNCLDQWRWFDGCGCSYSEWSRYSAYSPYNQSRYLGGINRMSYPYISPFDIHAMNGMYGGNNGYWMSFGMNYGYGYGIVNPYYRNPYYYNDPWYGGGYGYNPYGGYGYNPYGGYGYNPYGGYGYNPYGGYGYNPYGGYGYGGNSNGWSNNSSSSNVTRQHRSSTTSGYYTPTGRSNSSSTTNSPTNSGVKTYTAVKQPTNDAVISNDRNTVFRVKEVGDRETVTRPNRPDVTDTRPATGVTQPDRGVASPSTNPGRTITNPSVNRQFEPAGRQNDTYQITYPDRNRNSVPSNSRINNSNYRNTSPGSYERTSPSREPATISSPNREPARNSSPATPSNSGRSGGSFGTSTTSGRR